MKFPQIPKDSILLTPVLHPAPLPVLKPKAKGSLRVATFNAHFGRNIAKVGQAFLNNPNLALADVILLQEIEHRSGEKTSSASQLAKRLGLNFAYTAVRRLSLGRGTHGLAILSRLPINSTTVIKLPVYPLLRFRPRLAVCSEVDFLGKKIKIYNVHLNGPLNYAKRILQLRDVLVDISLQNKSDTVILGGDFNTIPLMTLAGTMIPLFYDDQKNKFHLFLKKHGFMTNCEEIGYTMRRGFVRFQLDGIYPKNAKVAAFGIERSIKLSDHFPMWADIKV